MYLKLTNGQLSQFPYTVEQFRRENPHTSFPRIIPDTLLRRHGVYPVEELPKPNFDPLVQTLERDALPHKEVIYLKSEEDATDPFTGEVDQEQIGQPVYGNRWLIGYTAENVPQKEAERNVRAERNSRLSETDWMALSDNTMTQEWADYRQALRDVTAQEGFPYSVEWPTKPENK